MKKYTNNSKKIKDLDAKIWKMNTKKTLAIERENKAIATRRKITDKIQALQEERKTALYGTNKRYGDKVYKKKRK